MTKDEINRKISEVRGFWQDIKGNWHRAGCKVQHSPFSCSKKCQNVACNWTGSEDASAVLRAELPRKAGYPLTIHIDPNGYTMIDGLAIPAIFHEDYKTAIALTWLAVEGAL